MKLSDTQLTILSAASQREDRAIVLPERVTGGAADKVVNALAGKGLIEAVTPEPGMPVWRKSEDGRNVALRITDTGLEAIGIAPELAQSPASDAAATDNAVPEQPAPEKRNKMAERRRGKATADTPKTSRASRKPRPTASAGDSGTAEASAAQQPRTGTKLERFVELLRRPEGVSIKEASDELAWMQHSVRGAVAGALKKKYALTITTEKVEGRGTVYRISP